MEEHRFGLDESTTCDQKQTNPDEFKCLIHACRCRDANCQRPRCQKMKEVAQHVKSCRQKSTGCKICKGLHAICSLHKKNCQNRKCPVPFCIKKRFEMLQARLQQAQILKRGIATKQNRQMSDAVLQTSPGTSSQPSPSARPHTSPHPPQPDASTQTEAEVKKARVLVNDKQSSEERGIENKVLEDMGKLFESGKRSNVTVQVKESEFKVHSSILCARSPVLSAMLEHDTAERASNRITIEDCDADVFKEYLRYLYTGSVRSLTRRTVFGLYRVADKYLANDLKLLCLEHVRGMLCVQTFCETVKLALTHREYDLLRLAVDFAAHNIQSILRSVEWQNFICEYPREANEILIKSVHPQSWTAMDVDDNA